ncbi:hypothetical protein CYY_006289 [Polysphondylium violaceum]|uniref:PPM-type phosphatase domain-containing protein n=1 Tax=Polysphondylium violaceum TaxID=133409 RepID=A0A8J4PS45_9MYCE|nr:hypothetical protein CYY_006289 [Polysphondylium violaceum]
MNIINYFRSSNGSQNGHGSNYSASSLYNMQNSKGSFVPSPILYMTPMVPIDYGCPDDMLDDGKSDSNLPSSQNTSPQFTGENGSSAALDFLDHLNFEMKYGSHTAQGTRKHMEDRYKIKIGLDNNPNISIFGVFDGHGGEKAADFVKKKIVHCINKNIKENRAGYSNKNGGSLAGSTASYSLPTSSSSSSLTSGNPSSGGGAGGVGSHSLNSSPIVGGFDSPNWYKYNNHLYNQNNFQQEIQTRSEFLQTALYNTFHFLDSRYCKKYRQKNEGGTTCIVALLSNPPNSQPLLVVANAGDSRGVLCRNGKAIPLSYDHKPGDPKEKQRILANGGKIEWDYNEKIWRVAGILSVSRGIGDIPLKKWVVCDPEFVVYPLKGPTRKCKPIISNSSSASPSSPMGRLFKNQPSPSAFNRLFFSPSFAKVNNNANQTNTSTNQLSNSGMLNSSGGFTSSPRNSKVVHDYYAHSPSSHMDTPISSPHESNSGSSSSGSSSGSSSSGSSSSSTNHHLQNSPSSNHKMYYCSAHQFNYGEVDQYFVLATDGIWDVFENQEIVDYINATIEEMYHSKRLDWEPNEIAKKVVQEAAKRGSGDNSTVLIIKLYW